MADYQLSEGVKLSSDNRPTTLDLGGAATMMVVLWDKGPQKPKQPARPNTPQGKQGDPVYELAKAEFEETLENYKKELAQFRREMIEFDAWWKKYGGPYEMFNVWSVDAGDHLANDPQRYCISASTRGYAGLPNRGLPDGVKPGHGHAENIRRIQQGESDLVELRKTDPVFGKQELRS